MVKKALMSKAARNSKVLKAGLMRELDAGQPWGGVV